MSLATPLTTFGDLARDGMAINVVCSNCSHNDQVDGNAPRVRAKRIGGARFRCKSCGSSGLPTLGKVRPRWVDRHRLRIERQLLR